LVEGIKTAALKKLGNKAKVDVRFDEETGEINVYRFREVVDKVVDPAIQISLEEAQKIDPSVKIGDLIGELVKIEDLGRIAAQVVKQVFSQKIRLAERHQIYEEYKHKLGEIITGYVHKFNRGDVILNLGRAEALLPESEQIPGEKYHRGERVKALVIEVYRTKEPQIVVSRSHPAFVKKLFEKEVP
jgi:N utilization substance protein A